MKTDDALVVEYQALKDDERTAGAIQAALISVLIVILGGIATFYFQGCAPARGAPAAAGGMTSRGARGSAALGSVPIPAVKAAQSRCAYLHPLVWLVMPLAPLAILGLILVAGAAATIRSFHMRAIERSLQSNTKGKLWLDGRKRRQYLPPFSHAHLLHSIGSQTSAIPVFKLITYTSYVIVVVVPLLPLVASWSQLHGSWRVALIVVHLPVVLLGGTALWFVSVRGDRLWLSAVKQLPQRLTRPIDPLAIAKARGNSRTLGSYLRNPRRQESVVKPTVLWVAFLLASLGVGGGVGWRQFVLVLLAFEFCVYQARYQANDLIDRKRDASHPDAPRRSRIPPPALVDSAGVDSHGLSEVSRRVRIRITLVAMSIFIRIGLWLLTVLYLWPRPGMALLIAGIAVAIVAIPYEISKALVRRNRTPAPRLTLAKLAVYVTVGLGYALRAGFGVWLGVASPVPERLLVSAALTMGAMGIMFVTMTWLFEGTSFALAGARSRYLVGLDQRRHLAPLLVSAGLLERNATAVGIGGRTRRDESVLLPYKAGRGPAIVLSRLRNPWSWSCVAAGGSAYWFGLLLGNGVVRANTFTWGVLAAVLISILVVTLNRPWSFVAGPLLLVALWTFSRAEFMMAWIAVIPLALVYIVFLTFQGATYEALSTPPDPRVLFFKLAGIANRALGELWR